MKNFLPCNKPAWMLAVALFASAPVLHAATTDIANSPPVASAIVAKPNVMFILDNSGSTSSDNMPDNVNDVNSAKTNCTSTGGTSSACSSPNTAAQRGDPPYYTSAFNGVYYDPQVTYLPGKNFDGTSKPSQVSPWTAVSLDGYLGGGTINLTTSFPERVYCNSSSITPPDTTNCRRNGITVNPFSYTLPGALTDNSYPNGTSTGATTFRYPKTQNGTPFYYDINPVEYCDSVSLVNCIASATPSAPFTFPAPVRFCKSLPLAGMPAPVTGTSSGTPNCKDKWDKVTYQFARYGRFLRTNIVNTIPSYFNRPNRSDCAAAPTCTYAEEMTNFANWYTYYRKRLLTEKTAAGRAFVNLGSDYRVGFITINPGTPVPIARYLPIATFDATQKNNWFNKLYSQTNVSGTTLQEALSRVGRHYAGITTGINAGMPEDPVQFSCQQNFAILTTDGYWNSPNAIKIDGTAVGNQDNDITLAPRPFFDGNIAGATNTLADVAAYYYNTDLRTATNKPTNSLGVDVTLNNVPSSTADPAKHQHMTTFTMGVGADGLMTYQPDYETATSGDYANVKAGSTNTSTNIACSWVSVPGICNWPLPTSDDPSAIDDTWHAAVNGHGTYFSAKNPASVVSGIATSFFSIAQRTGAVAAPATSNPNLVPGDNFLFTSTFTTLDWTSEVKRRQIDLSTGTISSTVDWTAQAQLDAKTGASTDTRTLFTFDGSTPNKLKNFLWANLTVAEKAFFDGTSGGRGLLSQWGQLSNLQKSNCDTGGGTTCGEKLVNFLRGQRGFETTINILPPDPGVNSLFRKRAHILGDIVNAEAVYVRQPVFDYFDPGYTTFKTAQASRPGTLYAAANDGMLHAFDANTGGERWAYIPSMVMPNMWKLSDFGYANNHIYLVDGTPTTGDICTSNCTSTSATWATLLVGGLNAGGRGYYAMDITDPLNPKALWELKSSATCIASVNNVPTDPVPANTFSDCDVGLSFGNPVITKRADGKWVVLVTSGYNNVSPGTGGGFLYVVDAVTGAILNKVATLILNPPGFSPGKINAGNTTTPSGFAKINAFAANTNNNNTSLRVYGGDLNGNLWRIDSVTTPNTLAVSGNRALLLAILGTANALGTQGNGTANIAANDITVGSQSITTKPELGEVLMSGVGTFEMVYVGTGRYLGTSDPGFVGRQSFYGIKDPLGAPATVLTMPRASSNLVQQTVTQVVNGTVTERHVSANTVDLQTKNGWFIDLDPGTSPPGASPGERSNTDPSLDLGILSFTTNAPNTNACEVGGTSYIYFLDYTTGGPLPANLSSGLGGLLLDTSLASRVVVIRVGDQVLGITVVGSQPDTPKVTTLGPASSTVSGKRINWRELNF